MIGPIKRSVHIKDADEKDGKGKEFNPVLYEISANGKLQRAATAKSRSSGPEKQIPRKCLKTDGAYLMDTGFHVYIWNGNNAPADLNVNAMAASHEYFKTYRRPIMPLTMVKERMECEEFRRHVYDQAETGCACIIL